jgi:hypothetical protein
LGVITRAAIVTPISTSSNSAVAIINTVVEILVNGMAGVTR